MHPRITSNALSQSQTRLLSVGFRQILSDRTYTVQTDRNRPGGRKLSEMHGNRPIRKNGRKPSGIWVRVLPTVGLWGCGGHAHLFFSKPPLAKKFARGQLVGKIKLLMGNSWAHPTSFRFFEKIPPVLPTFLPTCFIKFLISIYSKTENF